jgi:NTP pyrophosphatase (non-canonical NTP hydrolase)
VWSDFLKSEYISVSVCLNLEIKEKTLDEYQKIASQTIMPIHPEWLLSMGLSGEAGEVMEHIKKVHEGKLQDIDREHIKKELGDVLWYLSAIAHNLDIKLSEVAETNIKKVLSRAAMKSKK